MVKNDVQKINDEEVKFFCLVMGKHYWKLVLLAITDLCIPKV